MSTDTPEQQNTTTVLSVKRVLLALIGVALIIAVKTHFRSPISETYTGVRLPLDRLFDLFLAALIAVIATSVGMRIARLFRIPFSGTAEIVSVSLFIGTGVLGLVILGLGLAGLLKPGPIFAVFFLSFILFRAEVVRLYNLTTEALRQTIATRDGTALLVVFAAFGVLLLLRAATPPYVFDEAIYHLPASQQFVDAGRIYPLFNNSMGNQPFLIHMIYVVFLSAGSDIGAKFFSLGLAVATSLALYAFCQRYLTRRVGVIAIFAFFAAGMVTEVAVTTRVDVSVAGILFVTAYAMINYLDSGARSWLWTSALLAGFSLGVKHSAALWLLLVGAMYVIESLRSRKSVVDTVKYGLAYTVIAFAIASPWYLKNYAWFGNPFYPFFTGEVVTFGGEGVRYLNSEDERKLDAHFDRVRQEDPELVKAEEEVLLRNVSRRPTRHAMLPWEVYLKPSTYLMAEARHYPNYLFLVTPLLFFVARRKWLLWLFVLSAGYFVMATWSAWIARYLLPIYPALTIIATATLVAAGDWLKKRSPFAGNLPIYAVALALIVVIAASLRSLSETRALSFIAGTASRQDFRSGFTFYRPIEFINNDLPADASLMMVGAQMVHGIKRPYLSDETWFTTKWRRLLVRNDSLEAVHTDLKAQGVNHILFTPDLYLFAAFMGLEHGQAVASAPRPLAAKALGIEYQTDNDLKRSFPEAQRLGSDFPVLRNWATFSLYRKKFLETVYSDENGYRIYRLR